MFGFGKRSELADRPVDPPWVAEFAESQKPEPMLEIEQTSAVSPGYFAPPWAESTWDGEKYPGGLGITKVLTPDYWTLRQRSATAFSRNMYGRGLIRRLVTNVINSGLELNSIPNEVALGVPQGSLSGLTDQIEAYWGLWGTTPLVCDYYNTSTFGEIQKTIWREALIEGDVLVIAMIDPKTGSPQIRVVPGSAVQTPGKVPASTRIEDGVELDGNGRQVAYWVEEEQPDGQIKNKRIPAYATRTGRRLAWLFYGTDKRSTAHRGEPLLGIVLQSLTSLDQYKDATLLKAVLNAIIVAAVERESDGVPTLPLTGGARSKVEVSASDETNTDRRNFRLNMVPGVIAEQLAKGEKLKVHPTSGTDPNLGAFESATIRAIAWVNEIPPDVLELSFQNNFSASKGAQAEGFVYLNKERKRFGQQNNDLIYDIFFETSLLNGDFEAKGFLEAPRNSYKIRSAWIQSEWRAPIKPIGDLGKEVNAYANAVDNKFTTREAACQAMFGMKFRDVAQQLQRENETLLGMGLITEDSSDDATGTEESN